MGNSLRCFLACVLPFGALDLIRIVHLNGQIDEIAHSITAGEVLEANPNHVLSKPSSQGVDRRILIISPESELKRGSIYFLIPFSSVPEKKRAGKNDNVNLNNSLKKIGKKSNSSTMDNDHHRIVKSNFDGYLSDLISQKKAPRRDHRKSSRVGVWRPRLQSISED